MHFCPKCGNLLLLDASTGTATTLFCSSCPYSYTLKRVLERRVETERKQLAEILREIAWSAKTDAVCEECGCREAYFKELQIRSADEAATIFFKCANAKCGHQWNEG